MKNIVLITTLIFLLSASSVLSTDIDSTKLNKWTPTSAAGLNISQLALTNWAQGGDNSFSWVFNANSGLEYLSLNWNFRNNLKLAYGRTKLGSADFRTNDNELYLESVLSKYVGWAVDPYISNNLRTAIAPGYNYKVTPTLKTADFFDPAYLTQSAGLAYDRIKGFRTRVGLAVQEIITNKFTFYSDDTLTTDKIEKIRVDAGIESVTEGEYTLMDNLLAKSSLRLFSAFQNIDTWDVRWDNAIVAKVNKYINVNFSVLVVYERSQTLKTQVKQALQLGILYTLL